MKIRDLIAEYFELQEKIYDYFGYQEDWCVIPLSDKTEMYWMLEQRPDGSGYVVSSPIPFTRESIESGDAIYMDVIYMQRFLPRWVYPGDEVTMVCVDTKTDGNRFLMLLDTTKQCKNEDLLDLYAEIW